MAAQKLNSELSTWLEAVSPTDQEGYAPPIKGCKAVIAPFVCYPEIRRRNLRFPTRHAGYSYSGPAAAWAYKSIDTSGMYVIAPLAHL